MIDNKQYQQIMDKPMSRKAFFAHVGIGILSLVGITGLVKSLQNYTDKSIREAGGVNNKSTNESSSGGTSATSVITKSSDYTLTDSDDIILANTTGGNLVMMLPSAVNIAKSYTIKKIGSLNNSVTVRAPSLQTIDDNPTFSIKERNFSLTVVSDGRNWKIV